MIGCLKLVYNASCSEKSYGLKLWVYSDISDSNPHRRVLPALFPFYACFSFSCSYSPGSQEFQNIYSCALTSNICNIDSESVHQYKVQDFFAINFVSHGLKFIKYIYTKVLSFTLILMLSVQFPLVPIGKCICLF